MKIAAPALAATLVLAACGGTETAAENTAERLEEAAEVSTPAAEEVLEHASERVEERNDVAPVSQPGSIAQEALKEAGEAQVEALPGTEQPSQSESTTNRQGER